ncbi:hypothetical protein [Dongia sedimenti]|uniref:SH3 domain-containing protein n=1 Tax=Dongia sedimenti TaxID=3064282 RepID=A0ABU0YQT9_9PROT|nr:hypothetical protein [Rhodospirillaceae bacterium R-7]
MKLHHWIGAILLLLPNAAFAEDGALALVPEAQRLTKEVVFDPGIQKITIVTAKTLAREPKLPPDEAKYQKYYDEAGVYMAYPLDVKLSPDDRDYLVLRCDSGGSNDPQCVFSASQDPEQPGVAIPGTLFVIPGDGCVYSGGHTNTMFSARALHCRKGAALQPVAQPFSYAGFQSKALRPLTLYADQQKSGIVTTIAAGGFVEVVLQDGDFFLLRDGFGLVGWAALEQNQQATNIEGFFFYGD